MDAMTGTVSISCRSVLVFNMPQGEIMSRIPQPVNSEYAARPAWRPEILPADYSDEVTDADLEALRKISAAECNEDELELVDGPAW